MAADDAVQLALAPTAPLLGEPRTVYLAGIRPPAINLGAPPELVQSIRVLGLLEPLLLARSASQADRYGYQLIAGARRWDACVRIAGEDPERDQVPALVVDLGGWFGSDILSMAENEHRRPNIVQTLEALERLYGAGVRPEAVASRLGLSQQRQARVWRLHSLIPDLRAALLSRQMTQAVAEQAARLPAGEQLDLAASGRVTAEMVREKTAARREAAVEGLFMGLGEEGSATPGAPVDVTPGLPWRITAVGHIRQAIAAIPPGECAARHGAGEAALSTHLMCLVQAAVILGVNPAGRYEDLLSAPQLAALREAGWDGPGRPREARRAS